MTVSLPRLTLLVLLSVSLSFAVAQPSDSNKRSSFGAFVDLTMVHVLNNEPLTDSRLRPGAGIGLSYGIDTGRRTHLRLGGALYGYAFEGRDYALNYPGDIDPTTGEVDVKKSFVENETHFLLLAIPLQWRIGLGADGSRWFVAPGLEGRVVLDEVVKATIHESGVNVSEIPHETLFRVRKGGVATLLEIGRIIPWRSQMLQVALLGRYSLTSPFDVDEGGLFANSAKGRPLDLGVRLAIEF